MADDFVHLRFTRQEPINERRPGGGGPPRRPADPAAHAAMLHQQLVAGDAGASLEEPGFDPRRLLKLDVEGIEPSDLESLGGITVVSQERKQVVLLFATDEGLGEFKRRLEAITEGSVAVRQDLLLAIQKISGWTSEDRTSPALRREGLVGPGPFLVDVELWPLDRSDERPALVAAFKGWCQEKQVAILDWVDRPPLVLFRLRATKLHVRALLVHRDVRRVDLPPRYQLDRALRRLALGQLPPMPAPPEDAPLLAVLDSGIAAGHPLLGAAVGHTASYLPDAGPEDEHGHGTAVAGFALHGDVWACAEARSFSPRIRLLSGRVLDRDNVNATGLLEKQLAEAVEELVKDHGCRIFNVSIGDDRRVYAGGTVDSLAAVLDDLAFRHRVVFVVPTGNFVGDPDRPVQWLAGFPDYLLRESACLLDPAPGINVVTVGSLARNEKPRMAERFPHDPAVRPIARRDQPSPFTRAGPGPRKAIKPELVEYGGNWAIDTRSGGAVIHAELGELTLERDYVGGGLFGLDSATSFAAPKVAHLAALLSARYPTLSCDGLRALLLAHAHVPRATAELRGDETALRLAGYGRPDAAAALGSTEARVTLVAEDQLPEETHHFYEVPLPDDFLSGKARRRRQITVALAHTPAVRRTRADYRESKLSFRVIRCSTLAEVAKVFRRVPKKDRDELISEVGAFWPGRRDRDRGTAQAARWEIAQTAGPTWKGQKLFVVVTRQVPVWATGRRPLEPYTLAVVLEDLGDAPVRYYSQIRQKLGVRVRV